MGSPLSVSWRAPPMECMPTWHEIVSGAALWVNIYIPSSLSSSHSPLLIALRKQFFPRNLSHDTVLPTGLKDCRLMFSHGYGPVLICKTRLILATYYSLASPRIKFDSGNHIPFLALLPCGPARRAAPLWTLISRNRRRYPANLLIHIKSQSTKPLKLFWVGKEGRTYSRFDEAGWSLSPRFHLETCSTLAAIY